MSLGPSASALVSPPHQVSWWVMRTADSLLTPGSPFPHSMVTYSTWPGWGQDTAVQLSQGEGGHRYPTDELSPSSSLR